MLPVTDDRAPLLRAVLEAPDDDAPRLVLADWLHERGDPRGELIVVQCELARLGRDALGERPNALRRRQNELLKSHARGWLRPILGNRWQHCELERGFVHAVRMRGSELAAVSEALFAAEPVLTVQLTSADIASVAMCAGAARIRTVSLRDVTFGAPGVRALFGATTFTALEMVDLVLCRLGRKGAAALAEITNSLHFPMLGSLLLANNALGDEGAVALARAPILASVRELHLGMNGIGVVGARALAESPYLTNLERLRMWQNPLDAEALHVLTERYGDRLEADRAP